MDINQQFEPDRVYEATAWREAPWWVLIVPDVGATQVATLAAGEYMVSDMIACMFDVDRRDVKVSVVRGIGPVQFAGSRRPSSWFWAGWAAVREWWLRWVCERASGDLSGRC